MSEQVSVTWKVANFVLGMLIAVVIWGAIDGGDAVSVFSLEIQAWVLVLAAYLLGAVAMWAAMKSSAGQTR